DTAASPPACTKNRAPRRQRSARGQTRGQTLLTASPPRCELVGCGCGATAPLAPHLRARNAGSRPLHRISGAGRLRPPASVRFPEPEESPIAPPPEPTASPPGKLLSCRNP